jgi:uncharacterized protein Smg (DUF494 family)
MSIDRADRIERREDVTGGLGKPLDYDEIVKMMKQAGLTAADIAKAIEALERVLAGRRSC